MTNSGQYQYRVVDVFTDRALEGNPLAVFPHALGLDDVTMQKIARELNLSETVFVFPAQRIRQCCPRPDFHTIARDGFRRPSHHRREFRSA